MATFGHHKSVGEKLKRLDSSNSREAWQRQLFVSMETARIASVGATRFAGATTDLQAGGSSLKYGIRITSWFERC